MTSAVVFLGTIGSLVFPACFFLTAVGDLIQSLLLLSLLVSVIANVRTSCRPVWMFWLFMSVSVTLWLSAQVLWTNFEVILQKEVPNPFVGDVAIVLHLVPIVAALAIRPDHDRPRSRLRSFDFVLLFSWWLYLYLFFVIPWQYVFLQARIYGFNFDLLYFAGHLVVLLAATGAWHNSVGLWRRVYGGILLSSFVYAVASIAASVAIDYGKYYTGSLYDVPLLLSVVLFIRMALLGDATRSTVTFVSEQVPGQRPWVTALVILAAISLPALAAWAVFFSDAPARVQQYRLGLTLVMTVFVGALRSIKQYSLDKELARANKELHEASVTDVLTGARNRRFLMTTIDSDTQQALRFYSTGDNTNRNRDLIFYLIDIDHFKLVNDRFGHQQGDALLVQVAARISSAIRYSDILIRWGGEEFLVVSRFTDRETPRSLQSAFCTPFEPKPISSLLEAYAGPVL
jgi:diguanylate cyclase (GGDEF)-like protein